MKKNFLIWIASGAMMLTAVGCGSGKNPLPDPEPIPAPETEVFDAAKHFDITFVASGESNIVDSVYVENLNAGTSLSMGGKDILRLTLEEKAEPVVTQALVDSVKFEGGKFLFPVKGSGVADASVYTADGALITRRSIPVEAGKSYELGLPKIEEPGRYIARLTAPGIDKFEQYSVGIVMATPKAGAAPTKEDKAIEATIKGLSSQKAVNMAYNKGDLLRFIGKSGKMRTIVTNIPTLSHDIVFDFYNCTDDAGYCYPIVNAGGMLWMAEDLRYVGNKKVPLVNKNTWGDKKDDDPFAVYPNFSTKVTNAPCYYNYAGAVKALPDGWRLPTTSQVKALANALGGMEVAGEALKMRGGDAWPTFVEGNDLISAGFLPLGYMDKSGTWKASDHSMHLTRTTKNGHPIPFELIDGKKNITMNEEAGIESKKMAFTVRGCRPAPSAYNAIIESFRENFFGEDSKNLAANPPTGQFISRHNGADFVLFNHSTSYKLGYTTWPRSGTGTKYNYIGSLTGSGNDPWTHFTGVTGEHDINIRKAVAQNTANGYSRPIIVWFDRNTVRDGAGDTRKSLVGDGRIHLEIYNDRTKNFTKTNTSITLSPTFKNNEVITENDWQCKHKTGQFKFWNNYYSNRIIFEWKERTARQMSVAAGDITGDNNDDILVLMNSKAVLVDGATYKELGTITGVGNNPTQVCTIGDVNGDKYQDIVIIGNGYDNASSTILVYLGSAGKNAFEKLKGGKADARKTITVGDYIDVKVGDVTGDGKANIVAYTSKRLDTSKSSKDQPRGIAGKIYVMDYQNMTSSNGKTIEIQEPQSHFVYHRGVELVGFRGPAQAKDIVGTRQVWRYGDNQKFTAVHEHPSAFGHRDDYENANSEYAESYMPKDGMAVGDFLGNGTEQLVYLPHFTQIESSTAGNYDGCAHTRVITVAKNKMLYVDNTGKFQKKQFAGNDDVDIVVSVNTAKSNKTSNFTKWQELMFSFSYAVPLLDKPKSVFKFKNYTPTISEPRIYALLAAPPYFAGYEYQNTPSTTWGSSRSNSSGTSSSVSNSASLIFGYEQEVSVFGINIGGFDFETQLTSGVEKSVEKSYTTTSSTSYSILDDDGVVMLVTPYDTYTYECVSAPSEDGIGAEMTVSIPREPRMMLMSLTDYTRLRADNLDIPDLRSVFTHTPGDPFSYPVDEDQYNVPKEQIFWADDNNSEMIGTGSSGMVTRSVEITDEIVNSGSTSFNMDVKLVAKSGGVKAGAGYSYSTTTGMSHSVGKGFSIEGQVMSPKNYTDITPFRWNVCWYKVKVNGQEFPVVNYLVRKN